ncbi:MAG: cation:proton antiporter [Oceanococcaceae bacterium]
MQIANALVLILALGVAAQWFAWRWRLPAIVLFCVAGIVFGPVLGMITPSETLGEVFRPVVQLCVAIILFEGGLSLHWHELRTAAAGVKRLVSLGALFSFGLGALAAHGIGDLKWPTALVFAAIIVVTGPTVIIPMLRQAKLNKRTAAYLKWEGIINDPTGALLAVLLFQYFVLTESAGGESVVGGLVLTLTGASALGGAAAWLLTRAYHSGAVPEFLKAPVMLASVLVVFVVANLFQHEAGLAAVTVMGLVLGNSDLPSMDELRRFKEYVVLVLVSSVFVMLTADLDPALIARLDWKLVALVATVMFVVRPLAIGLATIGTDLGWQDRVLLGWIAPRGIVAAAVAGVFGPEMLAAGYPDAELLSPLVFVLVIATVIAHGFTIGPIARRLGLTVPANTVLVVGASPWTTDLCRMLHKEMGLPTLLVDGSWHRLRAARLEGIPVLYGEVLSEGVQQSLELSGIRCVLAATSNDAYNALSCRHFTPDLGRDRVFQLPQYGVDDSEERAATRTVARPLTGVSAFAEDAHYEDLWRKQVQGWTFTKTRITDTYSWETYLADMSGKALLVGVVRGSKQLSLHSPRAPVKPKVGDIVISYVPPENARSSQKRTNPRMEAISDA